MRVLCESFPTRTIATCFVLLIATSLQSARVTRAQDVPGEVPTSGVELNELFRLGEESRGDTVLFGSVGDLVTVDHSGRILVGDRQASRIYAFSANGRLAQVIGQRGRGPGDFQSIMSIHAGPGDTLYVFDPSLGRLSAFEPDDLELAYSISVSGDSLGTPAELVGLRGTGFLLTFRWQVTPANVLERRREYVLGVDWTGRVLRPPVHDLPDVQFFYESENNLAGELPFGRRPVFRIGPGGELYAGWTESVDIAVIAPDGSFVGTVTHSLASNPVTREETERYAERHLKGAPDWYRKATLEADIPATKPAYQDFVVDDRNRIWLKVTPTSVADAMAQWLVLDADSRPSGQVTLPVNTDLLVIRSDRAYAVNRGEAETVIVYQIRG